MATAWERLATFEGGTVADLAAAQAADGSWHVFAATAVGIFRSVDRGRTWAPLGSGRRVAGAQVVAPSPRYAEDGLVYVGALGGVYRLDGPDASWRHILSGGLIPCLAVDPGDRDAPADGSGLTIFAGSQQDGILVSRDGGHVWGGANAGLLDLCVEALALSPNFSEDGIAFAGTSAGLYRTRNGAESWRQVDLGVTENDAYVDALALSPTFSDDRLVLVSTFEDGLFRSEDGGRSWEETLVGGSDLDDEDRNDELGFIFGLAAWSAERAALWTESGVAFSDDGGASWRLNRQAQEAQGVRLVNACTMLPAGADEPATILAGCAQAGVLRSEDDGVTWQPSSTGLTADLITNVWLSPAFPDDQSMLLLSLETGLRRSHDGGASWQPVQSTASSSEDDEDIWGALGDDDLDDDDLDVFGVEDGDDDDLVSVFEGDLAALAWVTNPAGGTLLAGGTEDGLFLSRDGGENWQPAWSSPPTLPRVRSLATSVTIIAASNTRTGAHFLADLQEPVSVSMMLTGMASKAGPGRNLPGPGAASLLVASRNGGQTWTSIKAVGSPGTELEFAL